MVSYTFIRFVYYDTERLNLVTTFLKSLVNEAGFYAFGCQQVCTLFSTFELCSHLQASLEALSSTTVCSVTRNVSGLQRE